MEGRRHGMGKSFLQFPRGAEKSILGAARQLSLGDESGPWHTKSRHVNTSVRREREVERQHRYPTQVEDEDAERVEEVVGQPVPSSFEHPDPAYSEDSTWYDAAPAAPIPRGRDGRFVSTGSSSGKKFTLICNI
ncbi:hypothetical protein COLO4_36257 [Corchorus olitorius]|uniref:Uncharacterized protein n=1 Tax=Corchorus olitorius TaxID=93759 RepID=A0A1R3GA76_9ROSI|nr:hypothetical protein COLO4_36257 [Corchorus olitorius]